MSDLTVRETEIKGLYVINPAVYGDNRGWFTETYSKTKLEEQGLFADFVQDNHSLSGQAGTLRGLHFQLNPKAQTKLIRCVRGAVRDVVVDLRSVSPTYKKWFAIELTAENKTQLWIPKGFAHGFVTLEENSEIQYKVDEYYSPAHDRSIKYDDPDIRVEWGVKEPILSKKDLEAPLLADSDINF